MRDAEPGQIVWTGGRWQPFVVLTAFLGGALYHLQSSDEGFRIAFQDNAIGAVARGLFRIPLVYTRSLLAAPDAIPIVGAGIAIVAAAWWVSLRARRPAIGQFVEIAVVVFMLATVAWLLRFGKDDWASTQDHLKDWAYYSTLRQAVETGQLPLYSKQAFLQTERYFANAEAPLGPHAILLAFMEIRTFFLLHALLMAGIGAAGLLVLRRELRLALFGWTVFVIALVLNSFTTWHLAEGNTPWVSMWLLPWIFWSTIRMRQGDDSNRTAAVTSLCLAMMIVNGAWHIFMWSAMIIGAGAIGRRVNLVFLAKAFGMLLALTAFRTVPAFLTVGGGHNEFGAGFASVGDLVGALLTERSVTRWWWFANTNYFVGWFGFALIAGALVPWPRSSSAADALRIPAVTLLVLSIGSVYEHTLFRLPVFGSERFTFRFAGPAALAMLLIGCCHVQEWSMWRSRRSWLTTLPVLVAAMSLVVQLGLLAAAIRPRFAEFPPPVVENLKTTLYEPSYVLSVRFGLVLGAVALFWVARQLQSTTTARS